MLEQHGDRDTWAQIVALYGADWFHVLLTQPARVVITFLVMSYTAWLIFFAAVYYAIDRHTEGELIQKSVGVGFLVYCVAFVFVVDSILSPGLALNMGLVQLSRIDKVLEIRRELCLH